MSVTRRRRSLVLVSPRLCDGSAVYMLYLYCLSICSHLKLTVYRTFTGTLSDYLRDASGSPHPLKFVPKEVSPIRRF